MVQQAQAPGSQALAQSYADTHTLAAITRRRSLQKMSQRHRSAHVQRLGLGLSCTNGTVRVLLSEGIGGGKQRHNTGRLRARAAPAPRPPRAEETAATHAIFNPPPPPHGRVVRRLLARADPASIRTARLDDDVGVQLAR